MLRPAKSLCSFKSEVAHFQESKFWGVTWNKSRRRWEAGYKDADDKRRHIGLFDTQEQAAHAVNAAIRRAGLEGRRRTNPVDADGRVVPHA